MNAPRMVVTVLRCAEEVDVTGAKGAMLGTKRLTKPATSAIMAAYDSRVTACPPWRSASVTLHRERNPCADLRGGGPRWQGGERSSLTSSEERRHVEENHAIRIRVHERGAAGRREGRLGLPINHFEIEPDPSAMACAERIAIRGRATSFRRDLSGPASPRGCASCLGKRPAHRLHDRLRAR